MKATMGRHIASARFEAGFKTAGAFADALGLSGATVSKWESDRAQPTHANLERIAELTGKPIGYFYGEEQADINDALARVQRLLTEQQITAVSRNGEVAPEPLIRIPLLSAGNTTDGGVIDVPRMLLPADVPPEHLVVAHADTDAPDDIPEGTMVIADRTDTGPGDGALVIAEVAGEIVVREHYAAGEMRLLMGREGRADRVPPTAILGRAVRAITIRDCGETTQR